MMTLCLGAGNGRVEFDDQSTDEVNILNANVGIGTNAPIAKLDLKDNTSFAVEGTEKIVAQNDREFTTSTGNWTLGGASWSWNGGSQNIIHTAAPEDVSLANAFLDSPPSAGKVYIIGYSITTTVPGLLALTFGGGFVDDITW
jgi:hypothetical protein